jgi:hypothetical protein
MVSRKVNTRKCGCGECRWHSPLEPGWEVCPKIDDPSAAWLWAHEEVKSEVSIDSDNDIDVLEVLAEEVTVPGVDEIYNRNYSDGLNDDGVEDEYKNYIIRPVPLDLVETLDSE